MRSNRGGDAWGKSTFPEILCEICQACSGGEISGNLPYPRQDPTIRKRIVRLSSTPLTTGLATEQYSGQRLQ